MSARRRELKVSAPCAALGAALVVAISASVVAPIARVCLADPRAGGGELHTEGAANVSVLAPVFVHAGLEELPDGSTASAAPLVWWGGCGEILDCEP